MRVKQILDIALIILCISSCSGSIGQQVQSTSSTKKLDKAHNKALKVLNGGDQKEAIILFNAIITSDNNYLNAHKELSTIYYRDKRYQNATYHLLQIIRIDPTYNPKVFYTLGNACYLSGDYNCAIESMTTYLLKGPTDNSLASKAEIVLKKSRAALGLLRDSTDVNIQKMPPTINSPDAEYLPSISLDGKTIIFTRRSREGEDYYYSNKIDSAWTQAVPFTDLNTNNNEGSHAMSANGDLIIITGCNWKGGVGGCDLYYSQLKNEEWTKPRNMGDYINTPSWESQPSLSSDGKALYFASTRPGGEGGADIWVSLKNDKGLFVEPINAGDIINTNGNEHTPFIHVDNRTLYFSSNGHEGLGDMDLFLARKNHLDEWQELTNLGYPLNTSSAEGALIVSSDGQMGYYAKQEEGSNNVYSHDLYQFKMPSTVRPIPTTYVLGVVKDKNTDELINNLQITIYDNQNDKLLFSHFTKSKSKFKIALTQGIDYGIRVEKEGYIFYSDRFVLQEKSDQYDPYFVNIYLEKVFGSKDLSITQRESEPIILRNIFFDIDKYVLLPESFSELETLFSYMIDYPDLTIELRGHTDNTGQSEHNQKLSENRAKAVYDYLKEKGISIDRLMFKGFGAEQPLADNQTTEGRRRNRRTEFVILR